MATKRPQNYCKSCGYTWFPRGKDVSAICPSCGSRETAVDNRAFQYGLIAIVVLIVIGWLASLGGA
jgi:predicted RNA-binding Zn-ribbon protein involved in translation (DUF1610 family)